MRYKYEGNMDKETLNKYGISEEEYQKEYEKTFQYQFEQLEKSIGELISIPEFQKLLIVWVIGLFLILYFLK